VPMGNAIYLVANFKETQVGAMVEGQAVTFTVDAFDDRVFHGLSAEAIVDTRGRSNRGSPKTITVGALKAENAQP
jgi:multidrug resistance efflux pump